MTMPTDSQSDLSPDLAPDPGLPPIQAYRRLLAEGTLRPDPGQALAVEKLQLLHSRLKGYDPHKPAKVLTAIFGWGREKMAEEHIPGLYLYGGVGRGKSMLMDLFFASAPVAAKERVHFHAYMQEVHGLIHEARARHSEDPIAEAAAVLAPRATLLCLDEMQITDITDAMIVGRLFEKFFEAGVVVVTTSNRHPDDLYKDGLNRQLFLPFIELIKTRLEVHQIDQGDDHRQGRDPAALHYICPLGAEARAALDAAWQALAGGPGAPLVLPLKGRDLVLPEARNGVARASFAELCEAPLGPPDHLAIAGAVETLILDDIPVMSRANQNAAKRFVTLIDALYEARVRLICSAAAEPEALYVEGEGSFEFERTASRLREMQAESWPD